MRIVTEILVANPLTVALAKANPVMLVAILRLLAAENVFSFIISPKDGVILTVLTTRLDTV